VALNKELVSDELEECGRKQSWPNLRYYPSIFLDEVGGTTKKPESGFQSEF
jgi:hypothetical protein